MLRAGASPNAANAEGTTPLYAGAQNEAIEMVRGLLEAGADPNVESKDESEGLPLCGAACWGSLETVVELLKHGADPNLREDGGTGATPLSWAATNGHADVARVLRDARGRTPLEAAEERAGKDVESELRHRLESKAGEGDEIVVRREPRGAGTELIEVMAYEPDGGGWGFELETGHAEIVALLRARAGEA